MELCLQYFYLFFITYAIDTILEWINVLRFFIH